MLMPMVKNAVLCGLMFAVVWFFIYNLFCERHPIFVEGSYNNKWPCWIDICNLSETILKMPQSSRFVQYIKWWSHQMEINLDESCKSYLYKTRNVCINCLIDQWIIKIVNAFSLFLLCNLKLLLIFYHLKAYL